MGDFLLNMKRGETPVYRVLRSVARFILNNGSLPIPRFFMPILAGLYHLHSAVGRMFRRLLMTLYIEPLFRGRCSSVGKNLTLSSLPYILGHSEIVIGDSASFGYHFMVITGRFLDHPRLQIGNGASFGDHCAVSVNQEVIIEDAVAVGDDCRITDNDGHPREAALRAQNAPLTARDIRPVRICTGVRIGSGSQVMKGVTIGEGAVIGPNSVVISSLPPYCYAAGNPAEIRTADWRNAG
ncbi:MAG: acyltransferase [Acidobacteriia bacterium]|nr:acyltransferase [Terriglobia bacterium]